MSDTAIVGENVEVIQTGGGVGGRSAFSWSVVFAGALAAMAVSFIFIWLGSGIGLSVASPYVPPDGTTMTAVGAIWLLLSQTIGFAVGGYLAGRLRIRNHLPGPETLFRDAAHGFMTWVLCGVFIGGMIVLAGVFSGGAATFLGGQAAQGSLAGQGWGSDYYVDRMFRPGAGGSTQATPAPQQLGANAPQAGNAAASNERAQRVEANRILMSGVASGKLSDEDRGYLARNVAARTGMPLPEAEKRVSETETQAVAAADKARKAGAFVAFWSFMALLFGAVAATLAGMLGGELRDQL